MNDSLTKLSNKMEQLEQWASTEHAQLKADLASAAEQSRNGVWEFGNKMKDAIEEHISGLEKVSMNHFSVSTYCKFFNILLCICGYIAQYMKTTSRGNVCTTVLCYSSAF